MVHLGPWQRPPSSLVSPGLHLEGPSVGPPTLAAAQPAPRHSFELMLGEKPPRKRVVPRQAGAARLGLLSKQGAVFPTLDKKDLGRRAMTLPLVFRAELGDPGQRGSSGLSVEGSSGTDLVTLFVLPWGWDDWAGDGPARSVLQANR